MYSLNNKTYTIMKKKILMLASLGMLTSFLGQAQEKEKLSGYIEKINNLKKGHCKLSKGLESLEDTSEMSSKWITKGDKVLVDALAADDVQSLKAELVILGMTDIKVRGKVISGYIAKDNVSKMNNCNSLSHVMPEFKPTLNVGSVTNEATSTMFTAEASKIFGVNGEGVKIGILSDSFNTLGGMDAAIASGDLPGPGNPNGFTTPIEILSEIIDGPGIDEGRGMAELVHDIAPAAEIAFYSAFNGFFDFADGIRALRAAGCDVIVDDIGYFASPYFQDSAIGKAVDEVVADGAVYFSSAGNSSLDSYEDDYKEVNVDGLAFYDFGGGDVTQTLVVQPGANLNLWFQWDDPSIFADPDGPLPDTDIDVLLFDVTTGELLDSSLFFNEVDGFPIEIVGFENLTAEPVEVEILVQHLSGPVPRRLKYMENGDGLNFVEDFPGNGASTCYGHSNAAGAIAVGAQAFVFNDEFRDNAFGGTTAGSLNGFSSFGGLRILLDDEGNSIEPIDRQKPDVVATDGSSNTFFGGDFDGDGLPNFFGTSAAAPNAAAVAALMLQLNPDLTPQEIGTILDETALDMDNPLTEGFDEGYDPATGRGFVQADKALAAVLDEPTVYRYQAYDATTNEFLQTLTDDSTVSLETIDGGFINVVALATNGLNDVKSVKLSLSGAESRVVTDSQLPFSLFGDNQGDFINWEVKTGAYELSSSAFSQMNATGNTYTINFGVDYQALISSFILVNADTNEDIMPLSEIMDYSVFQDNPNVTIRAEVGSPFAATAFAEKVQFNLSGALQRYTEDNSAPYSLFGDNAGDFNAWQPSPIVGEYTIEATPFARSNGTGTAGTTTSFSFEIVDDSIATFANNFNESIVSLDAATRTLSVSSSTEENISFSIFNAQGSPVYQGVTSVNNNTKVNLSKYGSGLFIVQSEDRKTINAKVYINK